MGSLEKDIETVDVPPEERPIVNNDLDIPDDEELESTETSDVYLNKIARRVREYTIKEFNPPRPGKKLLVLDIDYTIFDHRSAAESGSELMRPGTIHSEPLSRIFFNVRCFLMGISILH